MWPAKALLEWHDFYVLTGTAGATLIALLFVAVSLGTGYLTKERALATRTFMTPVVIHFASVFFLSAVALFPTHRAAVFAGLIGVTACMGLVVSAFIVFQAVRTDLVKELEDHLAYGILPMISYVALLVAAILIFSEFESSLDFLAGALLLLLIINIRNAWDITLHMVRINSERISSQDSGDK